MRIGHVRRLEQLAIALYLCGPLIFFVQMALGLPSWLFSVAICTFLTGLAGGILLSVGLHYFAPWAARPKPHAEAPSGAWANETTLQVGTPVLVGWHGMWFRGTVVCLLSRGRALVRYAGADPFWDEVHPRKSLQLDLGASSSVAPLGVPFDRGVGGNVIGPLLRPGETLLWVGQPRQGLVVNIANARMVPVGFVWGAFGIWLEWMVIAGLVPWPITFVGLPFVLVGLYLTGGEALLDRWQRAGTYYGVTTERVVIISGLFRRGVTALEFGAIDELTLTERPDQSGTVRFGVVDWEVPTFRARWLTRKIAEPAFELLVDAAAVYRLIRWARAQSWQRALAGAAPAADNSAQP